MKMADEQKRAFSRNGGMKEASRTDVKRKSPLVVSQTEKKTQTKRKLGGSTT